MSLSWGIPIITQNRQQKLGGNVDNSESAFIQDSKSISKKYAFHLLVNAHDDWTSGSLQHYCNLKKCANIPNRLIFGLAWLLSKIHSKV